MEDSDRNLTQSNSGRPDLRMYSEYPGSPGIQRESRRTSFLISSVSCSPSNVGSAILAAVYHETRSE